MNAETQASIAAWRIATFGRAKDPAKTIARAGEEFMELVKILLPRRRHECNEMRDLMAEEAATPEDLVCTDLREEMADVLVVLFGAAEEYGFDLLAEVDRKMAVNRARKWRTNGDGLGQHI